MRRKELSQDRTGVRIEGGVGWGSRNGRSVLALRLPDPVEYRFGKEDGREREGRYPLRRLYSLDPSDDIPSHCWPSELVEEESRQGG